MKIYAKLEEEQKNTAIYVVFKILKPRLEIWYDFFAYKHRLYNVLL